jgi:hypothetical protein
MPFDDRFACPPAARPTAVAATENDRLLLLQVGAFVRRFDHFPRYRDWVEAGQERLYRRAYSRFGPVAGTLAPLFGKDPHKRGRHCPTPADDWRTWSLFVALRHVEGPRHYPSRQEARAAGHLTLYDRLRRRYVKHGGHGYLAHHFALPRAPGGRRRTA